MGCFPDDLRGFGINADQWTTAAAQDEGEWRSTAEQGAEDFVVKWIAAKKATAGLRHAVVMLERDGKNQGEDSPKQTGSCWFTAFFSFPFLPFFCFFGDIVFSECFSTIIVESRSYVFPFRIVFSTL